MRMLDKITMRNKTRPCPKICEIAHPLAYHSTASNFRRPRRVTSRKVARTALRPKREELLRAAIPTIFKLLCQPPSCAPIAGLSCRTEFKSER
jgi:hypothetical protein